MAEILLYGDVGCLDARLDAVSLVEAFGATSGDLHLRINSGGGLIVEGLAVYNALARLKAEGRRVIVHIDGLAASMASVVAMAGDEIVMADTALMMIHNPMNGGYGDAAELRKAADQLDALRDQIVKIYAGRTGLSKAALTAMMDAETWFTAEEALRKRFVTSIVAASTAVNAVDVARFGFREAPDHPLIAAEAVETPRTAVAAPATPKEIRMDPNTTAGTTTPAEPNANVTTATNAVTTPPAGGITEAQAKAQADAAVAAERSRASGIRQAVAKAKLPAAFAEELVDAGTTIEDARAKIIDKLADASDATTPRNYAAPIVAGTDAREKFMIGARNALIMRAGVTGIVAAAAKLRGETIDLDPGELRGIHNVELARMALDMAGIACRSFNRDEIVGSALTARNAITQTTSDFGVLLENVLHKVLQAAYATAPDTWSRICGVGTVTDFRPHSRYLRGTFGELDDVNEAGEFKNKPIPDGAKESISAKTKGNIVALTRQAIVNDDMDVFSGIAVDLGRAAKLSIEIAFYRLLALNGGLGPNMNDGKTFFHADHGNIAATPAAPSVTAFDAAAVQMSRQKDLSGNEFLEIEPAVWLGARELLGGVRVINDAQYDPDTANKLQRPNMVRGMFKDMVGTPRLAGAPWSAFADRDTAPAFEVVFLNGEREPFLESREGWRVDGTEWKVRHDFGVGGVNYRSALRNAGQ